MTAHALLQHNMNTQRSGLQVVPRPVIQVSDSGWVEPSEQPVPCGGARQYCCLDSQTYAASCTEAGLVCMEHGPDIVCEAPRCSAPAAVEGRPGVFACPAGTGGMMLVGTLV